MTLELVHTADGGCTLSDGAGRRLELARDELAVVGRALLAAAPRARPPGVIADLTFPGNPVVKTRPRVSFVNGTPHVFTTSGPHEKELARFFRYRHRHPSAHPIDVTIGFSRADRIRADLDNLLKLVFDAANGILWVDDSQVARVEAVVERGVGARHACTRIRVREALLEQLWPWPRSA